MEARYPLLLSPLKVGSLFLKNRVVMGSMHTRLENEEDGIQKLAVFYAERARGGVGLIITGSVSPNREGRVEEDGSVLDSEARLQEHRPVVEAVHAAGSKVIMQILHAGSYAKHDQLVAPSAVRSPINRRTPRALLSQEIEATIDDFVRCSQLAAMAGYDGVEIMGSEGYLVNQFTALRSNHRNDEWGGPLANRMRFPVEIVRRIRQKLGRDFLLAYRISAADFIEGGLSGHEIDTLAKSIEQAGADLLDTGVGWHESTVPTIATSVPRGAFAFASARLKAAVNIPVIASNRINTPKIAESILERGSADLIAMARPFLADPDFVIKAATGREDEINTCIGCNQACLDHIFTHRLASCLVNPRACRETEFERSLAKIRKHIAVIGAGPAGMACALTAAERGHQVVLYDREQSLGGQLNLASRIPGKTIEFEELVRYFTNRLARVGVECRLGMRVKPALLDGMSYDRIVVATGIRPRQPDIKGIDHPKVLSYLDVILGRVTVGPRVAIIGTGGIAHDVAELLTAVSSEETSVGAFLSEWGIDPDISEPGGLLPPAEVVPARVVTMFQRSSERPGSKLGKSTGWIYRTRLSRRGVNTVTGCNYECIDERGIHYTIGQTQHVCEVDHVIVCAGQEPDNDLANELLRVGLQVDVIGGARGTTALDAKRAIEEGTRVAYAL